MKKLLLPIDGSARSMKAAEQVRLLYEKEDVEVILMTVRSDCEFVNEETELDRIRKESLEIFTNAEKILAGYWIKRIVEFGHIGNAILKHFDQTVIKYKYTEE